MWNGRALWCVHAMWAMVLDAWGRSHPQDDESWHGVEFDKLAHFTHLVWNALHDSGAVSTRSPYKSADGVHGPGPALPRRDQPNRHVPALDALYHIQTALAVNPDVHMFDLRLRQYHGATIYSIRPGRERTYVPTQLGDALPLAWKPGDLALAQQVQSLLQDLTQEEIRAVGTHQREEGTMVAIEYNVFIHLFRRIIGELEAIRHPYATRKRGQRMGQSDLPSLESVVGEISRKARSNKDAYQTAFKKIRDAATGGNLAAKTALGKVLDEPEKIWTSRVTDWELVGKLMESLHSYLRALRNVCVPQPKPDDKEESQRLEIRLAQQNREGHDARAYIEQRVGVRLPTIPAICDESFPWDDLPFSIVKIFDSLPGESEYHATYDRYVREKGLRQSKARLGGDS